jgi:hypothetical protein
MSGKNNEAWVLRDVNRLYPINQELQNNLSWEICIKCHRIYYPKKFPRDWDIDVSAAIIT